MIIKTTEHIIFECLCLYCIGISTPKSLPMKSFLGSCLFLLLITCLFGCSKNNAVKTGDPGADTTSTTGTTLPSGNSLPSGLLYIDCGSTLRKINVVDSSQVWA